MESKSQSGQDIFVYNIMSHKKNGTFLEIGGHHPIYISNTYELEKLGWSGYTFDIDPTFQDLYKRTRSCKFIIADMTTFDWNTFLTQNNLVNKTIDYLSFDIDEASLPALKIFPFDKIKFNVMTIEHDKYRFGQRVADEMRDIILKHGYQIICKDIKNNNYPYEDWYVHSDFLTENPHIHKYICENEEWSDIINQFKR